MRLADFSRGVLQRVARIDPARAVPKMEIPRAPITVGAAGVALFLAELAGAARGASRRRALERALAWVNAAERSLRHPGTACRFRGLPLRRTFGGVSVFQGRAGVHTVAARVASLRGDGEALRAAVTRFLAAWRAASARKDIPTEVFFGLAGFVHAARYLQAHVAALGPELGERVREIGHEARARVVASLARIARKPLRRHASLGYAHGLVGELDAVLAWDSRPSPVVAALLDRVLAEAVVEGELAAWPIRVGGAVGGPLWASWCNGMAGHVYLWCRAYEVFRDDRYLDAARLAAQTTAALRPGNPTVCCGTAGQALALHRYSRLTGDPAYRRRASRRAHRACAQAVAVSESSLGYFGGLSGIAHVAFALHVKQAPYLPLVDLPPPADFIEERRALAEAPGPKRHAAR